MRIEKKEKEESEEEKLYLLLVQVVISLILLSFSSGSEFTKEMCNLYLMTHTIPKLD